MLFREKPAKWFTKGKPVRSQNVQSTFGQNRIAVRTVFAMPDMDAHVFALDIFITKMTNFANTQTGRIHECDHSLLLQIRHGINKDGNFLFGRDKGKIFVKSAHRKLGIIPRFVKDIQGKCNRK